MARWETEKGKEVCVCGWGGDEYVLERQKKIRNDSLTYIFEMFTAGYRNKVLVIGGIINLSSTWALRKCHLYNLMSDFCFHFF